MPDITAGKNFAIIGVGGYIAGRTSVGLAAADASEIEHRDGLHGLAAWAIAVVLGVALAAMLGSATLRSAIIGSRSR